MNDQSEKEIEIRPLSVRLRRRGMKLPFWLFRPVCWILLHHLWWELPKGMPYPVSEIRGGTLTIHMNPKLRVCIRCHKKKVTIKENRQMSIEKIRGKVIAYTQIMNKLKIQLEFHNFSEVKKSDQYYDVSINGKRQKIKAWSLPYELYGLIMDKIDEINGAIRMNSHNNENEPEICDDCGDQLEGRNGFINTYSEAAYCYDCVENSFADNTIADERYDSDMGKQQFIALASRYNYRYITFTITKKIGRQNK